MVIAFEKISYSHRGAWFDGFFAHDDARGDGLPGVLLVHEFLGVGPYLRRHAERLAREGYAVFACDIYGRSDHPADGEAATRIHRIFRNDRELMRERVLAGFDAMRRLEVVDGSRTFALGFSFGGCAVLELARSGADVLGVASWYGYLDAPIPCRPGVPSRILVVHGARDRIVSLESLRAFAEEMVHADVESRIVIFSDAGHGFANDSLARNDRLGSWYWPSAEERAWRETLTFFGDILQNTETPGEFRTGGGRIGT